MTPPDDAVCIVEGCTLPAAATRPITSPWLTDSGVITHGVEWVCLVHQEPA